MMIDPCLRDFVSDPRNTVRPPPDHVPIEKVRRAADAAMMPLEVLQVADVRDLSAPAGGHEVPFRLYRPDADPKLPVIVFCHGGGFVWGSVETHDGICRRLCRETGAAVASVAYRLAPETRFPGPVQDVCVVIRHLAAEGEGYGLDPERIALAGDSAGGNLALAATRLAMDENIRIRHLALIYPPVDPDCTSESQISQAEGPILTRAAMLWFWSCYLGPAPEPSDVIHAPLTADLRGFPPVTIASAELDPLRDEAEELARRFAAAGSEVRLARYPGMVHGFLSLPARGPVVEACILETSERLRGSLFAVEAPRGRG